MEGLCSHRGEDRRIDAAADDESIGNDLEAGIDVIRTNVGDLCWECSVSLSRSENAHAVRSVADKPRTGEAAVAAGPRVAARTTGRRSWFESDDDVGAPAACLVDAFAADPTTEVEVERGLAIAQ